ncbi:MAG TPA: AI-2E family transporter [Jiangellaceae bacterium]|nr:AI-2E family transporter [Jiangellaceae bacterium]
MKITQRMRELGVPPWLVRWAIIAVCVGAIGSLIIALILIALRVRFISIAVMIGFAEVSLLWPLVKWLRAQRVPQVIASILCVVGFLSFFALLLVFVVAQVVQASPRIADEVVGAFEETMEWLRSGPFGVDDQTVQDLLDQLQDFVGGFISSIGSAVASGLGVVTNLITVVLIATFFAIFALASGDRLWIQFTGLLAPEHRVPATAAFRSAMRTTGAWFYASVLTGLVDGLLIGLGLWILDVPLAVAIGALTFMLAFIPLLGATIAGAVAVAVAFVSGGLTTAIWALIIVLVVQQLEGNLLAPLLMARAVSFHPLIILVLTTSAATLFGMPGLFLAVPVTGAIVAAIVGYRRYSPEYEGGPIRGVATKDAVPEPDELEGPVSRGVRRMVAQDTESGG